MDPTISYTVAMPQPHTHLYHVTIEVDNVTGTTLDVALPVWTPGSYMIREYARHIQEFAAITHEIGQPLVWHKLDKTTWQIQTNGTNKITISYKVYANELSVRTSHLDGTHGYFNPTTVCMYVLGRTNEPLAIRVHVPDGWRVTTGLKPASQESQVATSSSHSQHPGVVGVEQGIRSVSPSFVASDYDELVDSPFECGTHRVLAFEVDGITHEIALWGHGNEDEAQLVADTKKIVETTRAMFSGLPYHYYVFIVHLSDSRGGGLEHRNSVSMLVDRWTFQPRTSYERYLGLTSHEFFHVWNVKRIRAEPLGPFDYSRENYTRQLWAMEGVTNYYTDLLLLRAGLISAERYLELLSEKIVNLQGQPGRALQSLEQSSFDAWIKLYRPDENTPNTVISYYLKGELVALLLDLELRWRTHSTRSLDDVLHYLYAHYPIDGPGIPEDGGYRAAVRSVSASDQTDWVDDFFDRYIAGTDELDYARALSYVGLHLVWSHKARTTFGQTPVWLGIQLKIDQGRTKIATVLSDGPAYTAGVYADDELVALDGFRVDEGRLSARLAERHPGDQVTLSLFRRDELLHVPIQLAATPYDKLEIVPASQPSPTQRELYKGWLGF